MKRLLVALVLGVNNGDFGLPDIGITNFVQHTVSPVGFEWEIVAESSNFAVSQIGSFWAAPAGGPLNSRGVNQSVQISRTSSIWQNFATTPGEEYELSFYYSHNPSGVNPASQIVTVAGDSVLFENTFIHDAANTTGNMMWVLGTATFMADSLLTTLTFAGPNSTAFNFFALDSVAVVSTVVPLPAAVWVFGSALGILGWMRRKQSV